MIKGAKAGQQSQRQPVIAKDSASSISYLKILYGLSEGEISGLADGARSIYLDDTPLLDDSGNPNFKDDNGNLAVTWDFRSGTNDQDYIKGFPSVENETNINVELKGGTPYIKTVTNSQLSAVRLRLSWSALRKQETNGDVNGITIEYAIDLSTNGGAYQQVLLTKVSDKTSAKYERSHRIDLPRGNTWNIRVRRLTPNATSDLISDKMYVDAITEIIDAKLRYPNTAMLGLQYNAAIFSNIAKLAVRCKGKIISVPSNYDPVARTYNGIWDGTFKQAYSNNPAWVYYDICTQWRYGLGNRLTAAMIDKWSLYALAQYCDEKVSDGKGGQEPRFTVNVYLQAQQDAFTVLQSLAAIFRAMSYWQGEQIVLDADLPKDPIYTFSRANVVDGDFSYTGTRARDRHTIAKVAWDNPEQKFKTEYEFVRDEAAIAKYGVKVLDLSMVGCTSQGQAQRAGLWALKSEQLETRTVTFKTGLDGFIPTVGSIINVSDEVLAGRANGGRVSAVSADLLTITVDRDVVVSVGDTLIVNADNGKAQRRIVSAVNGRNVTVSVAFDGVSSQNVWAVDSSDLKTMRFRVLSIKQDDVTFTITALQHEPQKYDAIDYGAIVEPTAISIIKPNVIDAPKNVVITQRNRVEQGQNITTMIVSWGQVSGAVAYDVEWRKDDGNWIKVPRTGNNSIEIDGVYSGNYLARVAAVSAFDLVSNFATSMLTAVAGKVGAPPSLASLKAAGILFGMRLDWLFAQGSSDTNYTEIQVASAPDTNVSLLGAYAYPTNTATINGLQGNLTQYYRARIVDKLGNASPWTAWVKGVTSADAQKVLDLLNGQITESQLHETLTSKIDKVDNIAPLELLVGDETKGLVKAIADERQSRIDAIGTSALEGSKSLHERADELANTVNGITEWQEVVDTDIEKSFAKMTYLASELDFGYADKKQYASSARGTSWTFAKTVARADYVNSELARGISADLANTKASFTEQITATATKNLAATQKIENLSAQVVGGYEGNDLSKLSSGLLYQEATARASDFSALSEQISLLSAGVGEQFDPYKIWHFDKDSEGWTGGTYSDGYINARTDKLQSPSLSETLSDGTVETLNANAYHHIKLRLEVVGAPTWSGLVEWTGGSKTITAPKIDSGVANVSFDLKWAGSIDKFTIKIAETADNLNYYKVDWIAVGRPSPGASSAAVLDVKRAFSDYKVSSSEKMTDLTSAIYGTDLTPLTASIREQLKTISTNIGTYAGKLTVLDAWYKGEDASMAAITKQQYEALTSADSANARKVDELFAEMDFGYADKTKFANINRSMQRTLAMSIAVADWNQSQRIDTLQSEFQGNTAQVQNELLTLASKDLSIASEQTRLSAAIGKNTADIVELSLAITKPETGLAAQVTQLQTATEAAQILASSKGEIIYSVAEPPAKYRLPQNLWFKKEGDNTTPHVWDKDSGKWVALTDKAAADAQATADAAKQAAGLAKDAADAKGEVIFSGTAPSAAKRLPQNLWIDTAGGANTPKRWDGNAWVEVTDKATIDAANAASAAQDAANAAQDAAAAASGDAQKALGELKEISDDDKLAPVEKKQLRIIVDDIKQVDADIRTRAAKYKVSTTEYEAAYTALITNYINDLLADYDVTSSVVRTEFNRKFNEFFAKRAQLDTSITIAAKSVADGLKSELSLGYSSKEKYANSNRTIPNNAATAIARAQTQANGASMAATEAQNSAQNAQAAADNAKSKADVAQAHINDISADGRLAPVEKKQANLIWVEIVKTDAEVKANAAKYKIDTTAYSSAYNALNAYLAPLIADTNTTSDIDRAKFDKAFADVYAARAEVNKLIVAAAEKQAAAAQSAANAKGENIYSVNAPSADKQLPQNIWYKIEGSVVTAHAWANGKWTPIVDKGAADAKSAADNKGEVIYSSTEPTSDKRLTQNLWVDTANGKNVFKRWDGSAWAVATDQTAVDLAKNKGEVIYSATQPSVDKQLPQNIWYKQETVNGQAVVTPHVWSGGKWTPLTDKGVVDAVDIANSKGEVITSDKIPDATKQLPQNLWIDTRLGKNTPRRWNGSAWEAVTDQAAIEAVDDVKKNLATYVKESGAYSTEFGNIAGEITTIQGSVKGVTDSIQVVAAIGDAERLKYEISKERLNKNKAALQGKVTDLDALIAKYKAQRTDAQAKKAQAIDTSVIALYDQQIALLSTNITDTQAQRDELESQVTQLDQEIKELASLKLTESNIKKQYFVKFDSNGRAAGFGIMENADATIDFAIRADKFYIAPPDGTGKGVSPFMVLTSSQTINGTVVPAGTYIQSAYIHNGSIDSAKIANAAITNAKIGVGEITSAKIAVGEIKTANIDNAAITTAKIGTAQVDTLQIAGEAVTIPRATNAGDFSLGSTRTVATLSMPNSSGATALFFGFSGISWSNLSINLDLKVTITLKCNGNNIKQWTVSLIETTQFVNNETYLSSTYSAPATTLTALSVTTGDCVYTVEVSAINNYATIKECSLIALGAKR